MNEKQKSFCEEYIKDFNGAAAARRAGYSEHTSERRAYDLLQLDYVREYLEKLISGVRERNRIEVDDLVQELQKIAFHDIGNLYDEKGKLRSIQEIKESVRRTISEIKVTEIPMKKGTKIVRETKTYNKLDAIEKLMRYLGAYEKDNRQKSNMEFRDRTNEDLLEELARIRQRRTQNQE